MARNDLLALTPDDLATMANRGLVKRAMAELDAGEPSYTLTENATGTVSVLWSDDVHCLLPSNASLPDSRCSCEATTLCRHLIRAVLAYQCEHSAAAPTSEAPASQAPASQAQTEGKEAALAAALTLEPGPQIWNPGTISDDDLARIVAPRVLTGARKSWDEGHVVELTTGVKPGAFFHSVGVSLRFLVPHDARYTHCDCAQAPPCAHVPLAVWAFRALEPDASGGLISARVAPLAVPVDLLDDLDAALRDLAATGVAGASRTFVDRLTRLEARCRTQGLTWPGDIVAEVSQQIEFHASHNARFEPQRVAQLCGELLIRSDAIRADTGIVPPLFVRGPSGEKTVEVGAARLIGLGTRVRAYRGAVEISAFLQDADSGAVVVVSRDFPDPKPDAQPNTLRGPNAAMPASTPFADLARMPVAKGVGLGALGSGQSLVRGGKRTPGGHFALGRAPLSFNPQMFEWQRLRAPLRVEGFDELRSRLESLPPAPLRPRRAGEDVCVCPVASVEWANFSPAENVVRALLRDESGATALLSHPYTSRGSEGAEALLQALERDGAQLRWISARARRDAGAGLIFAPLSLVFEDGSNRRMLQPWVDRVAAAASAEPSAARQGSALSFPSETAMLDSLRDYTIRVMEALGEWFLLGLDRADDTTLRQVQRLHHHGSALGFNRLILPLGRVADALARKSKTLAFDSHDAAIAMLQLCVLACLAAESLVPTPPSRS